MRYLFVLFYHFSQLLSEVPKDDNANEYIQLEPLCTKPNLPKYVRCLEPKLDDEKDKVLHSTHHVTVPTIVPQIFPVPF